MTQAVDLDALGLLCPLPVLKIRKRLKAMPSGGEIHALVDDPAAAVDIPHFCAEQGHSLLRSEDHGFPRAVYVIRKG